jgi:polysaccharide transporter, PST family
MSSEVLVNGARGGGIMILGQLARLGIQLAGTIMLTRLLTPADFGLIAMVAVFTALGALLRDFGISTAALQARRLSHQQASNLFWASAALSVAVALLLVACSPLIVTLYREPRLTQVIPALAVSLVIDGLQSQVQMQLARAMRYRALTLTDVGAQFVGLTCGVISAALGLGYWSLVIQVLTASVCLATSRTLIARWVPTWPRRGHGSKVLITAGGDFGLAQLLTFAANNAAPLMIGSTSGATSLGFFNRAFQVYQLPRTGVLDPLTQVAVPTLNAATDTGKHLATDILLRMQFSISLVLIWAYLCAASTAPWLIPILLGDQWHPSVFLFQLLAAGGAFAAFGTVSYWAFVVSNNSRQLLYLHLVTKPTSVLLIIAAAPFGPAMVAGAFSVGMALAWPINLIWLRRTTQQDSWGFFWSGIRVLAPAVASFWLTQWILTSLNDLHPFAIVILGALVATAIYVSLVAALPRGRRDLSQAAGFVRASVRGRLR